MSVFVMTSRDTGEVVFDGIRCTSRNRCPVCGHDTWCLIDPARSLSICPRTESSRRIGDAGWLHGVNAMDMPRSTPFSRLGEEAAPMHGAEQMQSRFIRQGSPRLGLLALSLGLSRESLERLGTGWNGSAWTFPMRNSREEIIGFRTRLENGSKLAIKGSRSGLFIPERRTKSEVWIVEGPTDVAAMLDMGINAIGRPACRGQEQEIARWIRGASKVIVVADNDGPGLGGAESLVRTLRGSASSVEMILPPWGMKDAREVLNHGGTRSDWPTPNRDSSERRNTNGRTA
jgi:hypothetical protein